MLTKNVVDKNQSFYKPITTFNIFFTHNYIINIIDQLYANDDLISTLTPKKKKK